MCRPHAAQYRRVEPATTLHSAVVTRSDPQLPARPDERGVAPAREDYVRRIRLGVISSTAAAREYLAATREHHTETDVNTLSRDWSRQASGQRQTVLGVRAGRHRERSRELLRAGLSSAEAETQAFTELAPDAATQQRLLADAAPGTLPLERADPEPEGAVLPGSPRWRPGSQADLAPSGEVTRIRANIEALRTLRAVQAADRPATPAEQALLARWSGWGAVPAALDPANERYTWVRDTLAELLDERELAAARRTVINAHYTDLGLVQAIWDGVAQLGFTGGQVLEPGCGPGNFIAGAPDTAEITGVELDPTTAAIAAALHPQARIVAESFAATRVTTGSFDAAVGNVPFGDVRLHDKRDNRSNHAIHNHFINKSLRATRPGGLVAVITSAYTMDATNPAARREMQQMGDLVGAVRLPSKAHARAAGTDALTDVLIFRRREDDRPAAPFDWEYTNLVDVDGTAVRINGYFAERPQRVLGSLAVGDGLYRRDEVSVAGDPAAAPAQLREALAEIAREASESGLTMSPGSSAPAAVRPAALLPSVVTRPDGYLRANANSSTFSRMDDGEWETYSPPKTQAAELRALLGLRDTAVALLEAEAASLDDTPQLDRLRTALNTRYDGYTAAYGPINRFTEAPRHRKDPDTGKMVPAVDEETGEQLLRRKRPPQGGFRHDPFAPVVRALEVFNEETQTGEKADIFRQRVVSPRPPRLGADTPADALAICVDEYGEARLPTIAWLLGVDRDEARRALGTLVYDDPASGRLETARAYLSGDVKSKLAIARNAADEDDRYAVNVTDLTAVIPPDMTAGEISDTGAVKMGAPWIGADNVQQFLREILDDPSVKVERGPGGMWTVHTAVKDTVAARSTWGTDRRTAAEIAQHILEQREFVIKNTVSRRPKRQVVDLDAVMAATEKAVEMRERFADWIWEDADRAAELVAKYNDVFQRYVLRSYDDMQLSLPGLAQVFKPDPHQVAGVARIIHEPAVGLYHTVGGGKTATMIMGAMELRRLGLARKPVVVVPNQLLDQWTREFLRLYPQAKVLAASTDDLEKDRRRMMVARMATGDWDAVILTEDAFEMLPMTPEAEQAYIDRQMEELEEQISKALAAGEELTLKRLETKKANREARLEDRLDNDKDAGIWWELTGIDYIFRDESHRDKNLRTVSNVPGMSIKGSQRASQMDMKLGWLRERQPRWGTRATGTPLANSIVEMYTEYRFLRPDLMEQQGITDVDTWLATYAEGKVIIEVTPDGGGLRNKTRLDFVNLEKLVTTLHVFADVKMKNDLPDLNRPSLAERADGQRLPEMVVVPPSAELLDKVAELVERAAKLKGKRPEKGEDNILKIVGEGAAAALDLRLVGLTTEETQKLDVAADRIAAYYHANKDRIYLGPDGEPHPNPGALQQVFCDMGTPNKQDPKRWTAYGALRQKLVERGVAREKIRFIHEAEDDRARAELFASCRDGRTAVLISSTEKGGTGVNAQDRMLVLHHLDTPYRPCDLEQREGRIDRRGNQNDEIRIERYVTERSLDAFKWQKVAYKSTLAERVLTGRAGAQTEDIGDVTLSYEEMKAASTGNPLLVDHTKAKVELTRLDRLERGYRRTQTQLRWTVKSYQQSDAISRKRIAEIEAAIVRRVDTRGDAFAMTVRGTTYTKRGEANERIRNVLGLVLADPRNSDGPAVEVGQIAGFAITAKVEKMLVRIDANDVRQRRRGEREAIFVDCVRVEIDGVASDLVLNGEDLKTADVVARLENRLAKLEAERDGEQAAIERRAAELRRAEEDLAKPFRHEHALTEARARFQQLDIELIALAAASEAEANPTAGSDDDDSDEDDEESAEPDDLAARGHAPGVGAGASAGYGRGGAPGQPSRTAAPAGAVAPPIASGQRRPAVAKTDEAALAEVVTDPVLTDAHRAWIAEQLDQLATEPRVVNAARANDYDNFRHVIDPILEDRLMDAMDVPGVTELSKHYFTFEDDETPVAFRTAFNDAASLALYERIRATPANATPDPAVAAPAAAPPRPASTAGAARNHTHYATFDKSRYDDAYACAEQLTRDLQTQPVVTMLDPHSERGWVLTIAHPHPGTDEQLQAIRWRVMEIVEEHSGAYDWSDGTELPANDESLLDYSLAEFSQAEHVDQPGGDSPDVAVSALATATEPVEAAGPAPSDPTLEQEGRSQAALPETQRTRRGHAFYPPADVAATVPRLYGTDGQPNSDKVIHLHYFAGGSDWWLVEYDPATGEGFGYACRGGDADMAEWGYVSLVELEPIRAARGLVIVERDLYWTPRPAREVDLPGWRAGTKPVAEPTETPAPVPQAAPALDTAEPSPVSLTDPGPTPAAAEQDPTPEATGSTAATAAPSAATSTPAVAAPDDEDALPAATTWTDRIRIVVGRATIVTGTTGHPREDGLRGLLKQHRFLFRGGQWRYSGRREDRDAAIGDIQRWLAARDKADAQAAGRAAAVQFPPTAQQQRIIDAYQAGKDVVVQALAGTGKTSTLLMLAAARPIRIAYIAFNRSIADEAAAKFGRNVVADTSHGFARMGLQNSDLRDKVDRVGQGARWPEDWARILDIRDIADGDGVLGAEDQARMVMATIRSYRESAAEKIGHQHLPGGLRDPGATALADTVLEYARRAWADITDPNGQLLFDHDDYLKIWALRNPRIPFEAIYFDEAQDINDVLRKVIQDQPIQTIVVGDSNQSIYGFRGAIDALNRWPGDVTLPLTQSWRFGPAIADVGNDFLRLLKSPYLLTGNPGMTSSVGLVDQPDAVLARTNAGAVSAVFDAFDDGRQVALVGGGRTIRDIAKAAQDLQNGRRTKHPELSRFQDWEAVQDYVENDEHAQSLRAFVRLIDRRGAARLIQMADDLVKESATREDGSPAYDVIVSTVHKSKGREWPQVRIADDFPAPEEDQSTGKVRLPDAEELRLAYVAVTRAREMVELGGLSWIQDFPLDLATVPNGEVARRTVTTGPVALSTSGPTPAIPVQPAAPEPVVEDAEPIVAAEPGATSSAQNGVPAAVAAPIQSSLFDDGAEARLARKVAARMPKDAVRWADDDGQPTVLLSVVANGTYGQVTGLGWDRLPMTAEGYVLEATPLSGGIGGWHQGRVMVVKLGDLPEGPAVATVQTEMDGRLTVRHPPEGMPAGEGELWTRMPVEHQILAARSALGLSVEVIDGPHNELWRVEGCPQQLTSEVAWWLFGGEYRSWEGRARPVFREKRIDEAIAAGRLQADVEQRPLEAADRAASADQVNEGTIEPHEQLAGEVDNPEAPPASLAGEPAGPEDAVVPARQARLAKALDDFGPRYTSHNTNGYIGDGSVVRYVVDGHVKEGVTEAERRWMKEYVDTHPEILTTKPLQPGELDARDRAASDALSERAGRAVNEGRFDEALRIIDEAEPLYSHVEQWAAHRIWVREAAEAAAAQPAEPERDSPGTDEPAPVEPDGDTPAVEMTATQRYVASELARAQTPYSSPKSRLEVYWQLDSWTTLPQSVQDGLVADLHGIVTEGEPRERSAARRLLDRWLGADVGHSGAQSEAVAAARVGSLASDAARVATYGQLSAAEYAALEPVHREAIEADLCDVAASGATQTIPRNRSSMGMTVRGVTANHVDAAKELLQQIAAGPQTYVSNESKVGKGVWSANLNPGDRITVSGREVTVDRVGLNRTAYLTGGRALSDRRYKLIAAGADPTKPFDLERVTAAEPAGVGALPTDAGAATRDVDQDPKADAISQEPPGQFTALEEAIIRNAVDDRAAGYYGGPLRLPRTDVPRYVSDGHLDDLVARHGRDAIWAVVASVIDADDSVLHRSQVDRDMLRAEREARAEQMSRDALAAFKQADYDQALALVERAELIDPLYHPSRTERRPYGLSWDAIRETITSRRDEGSAPATTLLAVAVRPPGLATDAGASASGGQPATAAQLARLDTVPGACMGTVAPARPQGAYSSTAPTATARTGPNV